MRRPIVAPRLRALAGAGVAGLLVAGCGGGGGAEDTITVTLGYGQQVPQKSVEYAWYDSSSPVGGGSIPGAHFAVTSGQLAPGTSLDASTGVVSGWPSATGSYTATVQLTISGYKGAASTTLTQAVYPITIQPYLFSTVNNQSSVIFEVGYLDSDGGGVGEDTPHGVTLDYRLAAGSGPLPEGMTLDPHSGQIQGTYGAPVGVYPGIVLEASITNPQSTHTYTLAPYTVTVQQGGN